MVTVVRWTGREAKVLRETALRMSVRDFAAHTGLSTYSISDLEAKGEQAQLRPSTQRILDEQLATASEEARQRFCATLGPAVLQTTEPGTPDKPHRTMTVPGPREADTADTSSGQQGGPVHELSAFDPPQPDTIDTGVIGQEVQETNRRHALTTALGLAGAASEQHPLGASVVSLLASLPPDPDELEPGHNSSVAAYGKLSQRLWRLYWNAPAHPLFETVYVQVRLGIDLLDSVSGRDRRRVTSALALSALLTARLAFFDLNRPGAATRCHQVALAAASEVEDHAMMAIVLGHMAFGPSFAHEPERAEELTAIALRSAPSVSPPVRSWLHCVTSEADARAGHRTASLQKIDLAEAALTTDEPVPEWFDFYDPARLDCFAGYAAMAAGDHARAAERLSHAAAELGRNGSKQRSVVLADLAAACRGDADQAAHHLHKAIDALEANWYRVGWHRVRQTRTLLGDSHLGRQLDQRLAILPSG